MRLARLAALGSAFLLGASAACTEDGDVTVPVRVAPPSRHVSLVEALAEDARSFGVLDGDWLEDRGDAPFYGLAWLSRRAESGRADARDLVVRDAAVHRAHVLLSSADGDPYEGIMAALGAVEHVAASGDRSLVPPLDAFVDWLDAKLRERGDYLVDLEESSELAALGPTAATGLVALLFTEYARLVGGPLAEARLERARAIDATIRERALTDLVDARTRRQARGYAFAPGNPGVFDAPNVTMLLLKARLFRVTKEEGYRLQARALHTALQALKISEEPARYTSPGAPGASGAAVATLATQSSIAFALLLLFEITGEARFVEGADRVLDGIASMRGPWCTSHVHDDAACRPACGPGEACVAGACAADRCTTGLLDHVTDGLLAAPEEEGRLFCAGCHLQALYVAGYRRALAGEPY